MAPGEEDLEAYRNAGTSDAQAFYRRNVGALSQTPNFFSFFFCLCLCSIWCLPLNCTAFATCLTHRTKPPFFALSILHSRCSIQQTHRVLPIGHPHQRKTRHSMNSAAGGNGHAGDSILLLPPSQTSTPAVSAPDSNGTFHKDENPASNNHSPAPSLSLSHRGIATQQPSSPSPPRHLEVPAYSLPSSTSSNTNFAASSVPTSRGQEGSRSSLVFHQYISTPYQSFMRYMSTPASDRASASVGFSPWVQRIPPWLIPQYHGKRPIVRSAVLRPLCRLLLLAVILAVLIASTLLYSFRSRQPELSDYSAVQDFDWTPINPRSYLSPMNASFGDQYDVLLDGHSHSTYSDGRMTPETLLKWHIGTAGITFFFFCVAALSMHMAIFAVFFNCCSCRLFLENCCLANGYNAVIVSDHNTILGGLAAQKLAQEKYADKITVIPAMELT